MSIRTQAFMTCDGCRTEVPVKESVLPEKWVSVTKQGRTKDEHFCPECWLRGVLVIYALSEPRPFNPTLD